MQTIRITTAQNIDIDYEIAGIGERIVAGIVDWGIFIGILFLGAVVVSMFGSSHLTGVVMIIIYATLFVFYDLLCEIFMNGQSFGKKLMKIRVISLNGARPKVSQFMMRWIFRAVDCLPTSYLCCVICIVVSDRSQRLGDMVAGTTLIRTQPRTKIDNVVFMPAEDSYEVVFKEAAELSDQDIELIHEVIGNYMKTRNSMVVFSMAEKIREHLRIPKPADMNDMKFLQTIIKDYNHLSSQTESLL